MTKYKVGNNAALISLEIIEEGNPLHRPELIMPFEAAPIVFAPHVRILNKFVFVSDEMRNLYGQGTKQKE